MESLSINELYISDCLNLLKNLSHERGEFIDLIYIDPPFNSKKNRYMNSEEKEQAFIDIWSNVPFDDLLKEIENVDEKLHKILTTITQNNNDLSYLTNLSIRIYYMHQVLKKTGSFYVHCDPSMSHYIKIVCDHIFGKDNFKNDIVWERTSGSRSSKAKANKFPQNHDSILFYTKSKVYKFNKLYYPYTEEYINKKFTENDDDGKGRYRWQVLATYSQERLKQLQNDNLVRKGEKAKNYEVKQYLKDSKGVRIPDLWPKEDIEPINSTDNDLNGYPTQKPVPLMERIIKSSSDPGDIVADFFCGSGSTMRACHNMDRKWIGSDISQMAVDIFIQQADKNSFILK